MKTGPELGKDDLASCLIRLPVPSPYLTLLISRPSTSKRNEKAKRERQTETGRQPKDKEQLMGGEFNVELPARCMRGGDNLCPFYL
jgi:hypothetical protein